MVIYYQYVLSIWLKLVRPVDLDELNTYLEQGDFFVVNIEEMEGEPDDEPDEATIFLQVQLRFESDQMNGEEPTDEALLEVDNALRPYIDARYGIIYFELLDDALTSYLTEVATDPENGKS